MFSICSTTVALNFEEVESHPESVPNVISCINSSVNVEYQGQPYTIPSQNQTLVPVILFFNHLSWLKRGIRE